MIYDYPKYYELVFGSDWVAERDFLLACFEAYGLDDLTRVFEPACGTGRLLFRLAQLGYEVSGNDLNPQMLAYCNRRLERHGFAASAVAGDMADFRLPRPVHAAFNMINSFRHLDSDARAKSHLECMARALRRGGIYILGLHLTPTEGEPLEEEQWSARRGQLAVMSRLTTQSRDLKRRIETVLMSLDVYTPKKSFQIVERIDFRTYTAAQMAGLIRQVPAFEVLESYDFAYDIEAPVEISPHTEDVVYVLRKR